MKKKAGFTLAEVLITLAVIGFVAALTMPSVVVNVQKQQVGPAFMKAVTTLESANLLAIQDNGVRVLNSVNANYINAIKQHVLLTDAPNGSYYNFNYGANNTLSGYKKYNTKDGITLLYEESKNANGTDTSLATNANAPMQFGGKYWTLYVDTNGSGKKPNALGRDVHKIVVDNKGTVIPVGGAAYKAYGLSSAVDWSANNGCNKDGVGNASACAGAIADNGGSVTYTYKENAAQS